MSRVLDAHVHLWDRARNPQPWIDPATMAVLDRDFGVVELTAMLAETGADAAVVVQSTNATNETLDLLALKGPIAAVVGWVDMTGDVPAQVDALRAAPGGARLRGVRHLVHLEADPEWLERADVAAGLDALADAGLVFDLVVRAWQLPIALRTVRAHPRLRFVLDHLANPPIGDASGMAVWRADLAALAAQPNVVAKLSGLITAGSAPWTPATVVPVVDEALAAFGPHRLLAGSDWPLAELAEGGAPAWAAALRDRTMALSAGERAAILGGTCGAVYGAAA